MTIVVYCSFTKWASHTLFVVIANKLVSCPNRIEEHLYFVSIPTTNHQSC